MLNRHLDYDVSRYFSLQSCTRRKLSLGCGCCCCCCRCRYINGNADAICPCAHLSTDNSHVQTGRSLSVDWRGYAATWNRIALILNPYNRIQLTAWACIVVTGNLGQCVSIIPYFTYEDWGSNPDIANWTTQCVGWQIIVLRVRNIIYRSVKS